MSLGVNRGIFGVTSAKKSEIEGLVKLLESQNPTLDPTTSLDKVTTNLILSNEHVSFLSAKLMIPSLWYFLLEVAGCWKVLFTTITILGSKRTKLGLRDFISLGDFFQTVDVAKVCKDEILWHYYDVKLFLFVLY